MTGRQATLAHEAGHVVGGLLAGHRIKEVRLGPSRKKPSNHGSTSFDFSATDVDLFGHLIAVLMGPMAEGQPPPPWPPQPNLDGDAFTVCRLVSHLRLSKSDYVAAVAIAARWLDDPFVKSAMATVADVLGKAEVLTDQMVRDALGRHLVAWLECSDSQEGLAA